LQIWIDIFLLALGFVLLIQSAKLFVNSSVAIAKRLRIPTFIIGLTVVAMGTSAPELVISVSAAMGGSSDLAIANIVGSNLFNLLFIVGFCALINPISIKIQAIARDYWVFFAATAFLLFMVVLFHDTIPRYGSFVLLAGFIVYMATLIKKTIKQNAENEGDVEGIDEVVRPLWQSIILTILGAAIIMGGGQLTVASAVNIADTIGVSERIIGLTIVAIGTSLPEFITTIIACRKNEGEFALGFIIGSCIFNVMFVLGIAGLITPLAIGAGIAFDLAVLTVGAFVFFLFAKSKERLVRSEGFVMLLIYSGYMGFVLFA